MLELAPAGIEQVDGPGWIEYAVYGAPGELPALGRGDTVVAGAKVTVRGDEVPDDWGERWRRFHHPVLVGDRLWVRPPWADGALRPGVIDVVIDPGRAFGTGAHPTTLLALELLSGLKPAGSLCDLGCGSGVIAIAAAKLGFEPVVAVDADRLAIEATRSNEALNRVRLAEVRRHDLRREPAPAADVVAANLMRPLLLRVADLLERPPLHLIASGLLDEEADEVAAAFDPLVERRRLARQGWSALLLSRAAWRTS
jgi:ribosomal protein L11 methyltransferase